MSLHKNQHDAVKVSLNNDFESGVHFHATGTGKSWIAFELILAFNQKYKKTNILWICERKSILIEQFSSKKLKENGYDSIFKEFHILNYSDLKQQDWTNSVNSSQFWGKSTLIIINRSFLTSQDKYKNIKIPIHLIIHDECHTIVNKSTQLFYQYMFKKYLTLKALGFSATPNLEYYPFQKILSSYSIYQAYKDNVIVQPVIKWFKSNDSLSSIEMVKIIYQLIQKLHYKKIIIWTGMIQFSIDQAKLWNTIFHDYLVCVDNSMGCIEQYNSFDDFHEKNEKALLFCAGKHREGSDIKNLDGCVFFDFVQNRYSKTFVQCIGRVLRKDKNGLKKSGLIIEIKAKSSTKIIDKMSEYLEIPIGTFPWHYDYTYTKNRKILVNTLKLLKEDNIKRKCIASIIKEDDYTLEHLRNRFIRTLPEGIQYEKRLNHELDMISSKKLIGYIMRALEILDMTKHIPHVTRGSCGSSLVCYLVGISHVDPIKYNIKFSRFLNIYRNNLPDIDFDFPYNMRDEVFLKLQMKWPGKIARISNHVYFHEKSATREGLRQIGVKGFISKYEVNRVINGLSKFKKKELDKKIKELDGSFRGYMLHCGGIVYYPQGVPDDLKLKNKNEHCFNNGLSQITLNKHDVSANNQFKIDILSSRALAQLHQTLNYITIDFEKHYEDTKTKELLMIGNNIGLTFAESPLIRKSFMKIKPKTIDEIAICLSIIRPAAKDARDFENIEDLKDKFVFDDDAIDILSKSLNITEDLADKYRRGFSKGDQDIIDEVSIDLLMVNNKLKEDVLNKLKNLRKYSFCKSHAYSYAQLVWQLAYVKAHYPYEFWKATLNHCESSYKKWVHYFEARCVGIHYNHILMNKEDLSIYSKNRMKKFYDLSCYEQLKQFGYWDMKTDDFYPGCYFHQNKYHFVIRGIIASSRMLSKGKRKSIVLFIGYDKNKYCEIMIHHPKNFNGQIIGVQVSAKCTDIVQQCYEAYKYNFF